MNHALFSLMPHLAALLEAGEPVDVSLSICGASLRLTVLPAGSSAGPIGLKTKTVVGDAPPPPLTPTMKLIVATLDKADRPLKGEAVARRSGKNYTGHFRTALAQLKERGVIALLEDGYSLPLHNHTDGQ